MAISSLDSETKSCHPSPLRFSAHTLRRAAELWSVVALGSVFADFVMKFGCNVDCRESNFSVFGPELSVFGVDRDAHSQR